MEDKNNNKKSKFYKKRYLNQTRDGKGYPFQYSAEDIPLPARIIAVADKFEALASKRPYKKKKSLKKVTKILNYMAENEIIDKHLIEFIYSSGLIDTLAKEVSGEDLEQTFDIDNY